MSKKPWMVRQGDVLLVRIDELPTDAKKIARGKRGIVLAEGEQTGHAHCVLEKDASLYESETLNARFLEVLTAGGVVHEEHAAIDLAPGIYRIGHQREYSPAEVRRVAD